MREGTGVARSWHHAEPRLPARPPPAAPGTTEQFFPGFEEIEVQTSAATIRAVKGGSGPPVLLLHGHPQTHVAWRKIAPALAGDYTVVAADLRGYGDSSKPVGGERHAAYAPQMMAEDMVELMRQLGFDRFYLAGHDRGGRVAHRLALGHPGSLIRVSVLDIVPTLTMYRDTNREFAT